MTDRTQLFFSWIEDTDSVTACEMLAFSEYVHMTVADCISRLRRAGVDVIPDSSERL